MPSLERKMKYSTLPNQAVFEMFHIKRKSNGKFSNLSKGVPRNTRNGLTSDKRLSVKSGRRASLIAVPIVENKLSFAGRPQDTKSLVINNE